MARQGGEGVCGAGLLTTPGLGEVPWTALPVSLLISSEGPVTSPHGGFHSTWHD